MSMEFEWDEDKRQSNLEKHGVDFVDAVLILAEAPLILEDTRRDYGGAKAICEALMHPGTTFIRAKSLEEQDIDHLLARRELLVQHRTQLVNQTRAFLSERGIIIPKGRHSFMKTLPQNLQRSPNI